MKIIKFNDKLINISNISYIEKSEIENTYLIKIFFSYNYICDKYDNIKERNFNFEKLKRLMKILD